MHCRTFGSTPGPHPLDASSTLPFPCQLWQLKMPRDIVKCALGGKIAPWLKTTASEQAEHIRRGKNVAEENAAGGVWGVVFCAVEDTQEMTALPAETPEY